MFRKNLFLFSILAVIIIAIFYQNKLQNHRKPIVAITQIVLHDTLDKVRQGVIDEVESQFGKDVEIIVEQAGGNVITQGQIIDKFVNLKPKVIVAVTTQSAQLAKKAIEQHIPIVFATVTDPVNSGLIKDLNIPEKFITGTRNFPPIDKQLSAIREMSSTLKKVGVIYSAGEANSKAIVDSMREIGKKYDFEITDRPISSPLEIKDNIFALKDKIDAIFLINDNMVASSISMVMQTANEIDLPVFAGFTEALKYGAVSAISNDEYQIGRDTGIIVAAILRGENDIKVKDASKIIEEKNIEVMKKFGFVVKN